MKKINDVVGIPEDVWLKPKMFDTELKNAGHISKTKVVTFVMDPRSRMEATLKAMEALVASYTKFASCTLLGRKPWMATTCQR